MPLLSFASAGPIQMIDGSLFLNVAYNIPTPVGAMQSNNLTTGANVITVPTGTTTVVIQPPAANTNSITIGGVRYHNTAPSMISLDPSVTSFTITAGGNINSVAFTFL